MTTPLLGWRYWAAGLLPRAGGVVLANPHVHNDPDDTEADEWWTCNQQWTAACRAANHTAPDRDCTCGYRIVTDLPALCQYAHHCHAGSVWPRFRPPTPLAFGVVEGSGLVLPGCYDDPMGADPPGTWRAEHLSLIGPLYLSPASSRWADGFRDAFDVEVVASPPGLSLATWLDHIATLPTPAATGARTA